MVVLTFFFVGAVTFGAILFFLRPTQDQKALNKRVAHIKADKSELKGGRGDLEQYLKNQQSGQFGWLEELVDSLEPAQRIQTLILQANSKTTLGSVLIQMGSFAAVAALIVYLWTASIIFAAIATLAFGVIPIGLLLFRKGRRMKAFDNALPDSIDMMARSLRAGHSLPAAISIVADQSQEPVKAEFSEVFINQKR